MHKNEIRVTTNVVTPTVEKIRVTTPTVEKTVVVAKAFSHYIAEFLNRSVEEVEATMYEQRFILQHCTGLDVESKNIGRLYVFKTAENGLIQFEHIKRVW